MKAFKAVFISVVAAFQWYIVVDLARTNVWLEQIGSRTRVHLPWLLVPSAVLGTAIAAGYWYRWYRSAE